MAYLTASVLVLSLAAVQATPALQRSEDAGAQQRWFFWIDPEPCTTQYGRNGTCYSHSDCVAAGGVGAGGCAFLGIGECCVKAGAQGTYTCNTKTFARASVFSNPDYPSGETAALGTCPFTVKAAPSTCQLRLDLTKFTLANPDGEGRCVTDYLDVTGATSTVPKICGVNDGQHLYVDVAPGSNVGINVVTGSVGEAWRIGVTQIACTSADRAPPGCLQYHTAASGTITSFNYNPARDLATNQLGDQAYGICIADRGYCSATYEQAGGSSFSLHGDPGGLAPSLPPPPLVDTSCMGDYLLISGSSIVDNSNFPAPRPTVADRFCGLAFPGAKTSVKPFKVYFITDGDETSGGDSYNQGFQLAYTLTACS